MSSEVTALLRSLQKDKVSDAESFQVVTEIKNEIARSQLLTTEACRLNEGSKKIKSKAVAAEKRLKHALQQYGFVKQNYDMHGVVLKKLNGKLSALAKISAEMQRILEDGCEWKQQWPAVVKDLLQQCAAIERRIDGSLAPTKERVSAKLDTAQKALAKAASRKCQAETGRKLAVELKLQQSAELSSAKNALSAKQSQMEAAVAESEEIRKAATAKRSALQRVTDALARIKVSTADDCGLSAAKKAIGDCKSRLEQMQLQKTATRERDAEVWDKQTLQQREHMSAQTKVQQLRFDAEMETKRLVSAKSDCKRAEERLHKAAAAIGRSRKEMDISLHIKNSRIKIFNFGLNQA